MTLSSAFLQAAFAQETDEVFIVLLTVDHADLPAPIRVTSDAINTVSRGDTYIATAFELELPGQTEQRTDGARLRICNVDREIVTTVRSVSTAPTVLTEIVRASAPDTVELALPDFQLRVVDYDILLVEGELSQESFLDEPYPGDVFSPATFPGIF